MKLADLTADARGIPAAEFKAKHGDIFLVGIAGSLRPPKRFEETRSAPTSPTPGNPQQSIDWIILPVRKRERSLSLVRVTVGRTANNDVPIEDPSVSRFHAFFEPGAPNEKGPTWTVKDAGSRLGTKVNGKPASSTTAVRSGDQITFGDVEMTFMDVESLVYFVDRMSPRFG